MYLIFERLTVIFSILCRRNPEGPPPTAYYVTRPHMLQKPAQIKPASFKDTLKVHVSIFHAFPHCPQKVKGSKAQFFIFDQEQADSSRESRCLFLNAFIFSFLGMSPSAFCLLL